MRPQLLSTKRVAKKLPLSQRRRWGIRSIRLVGTFVRAMAFFDILHRPLGTFLGQQFKAQDTIFRQVLIAFHGTQFTKPGRDGFKVGFQGSTTDGAVSIHTKGTGEDRNKAKAIFHRLVEQFEDFVFKMLSGNDDVLVVDRQQSRHMCRPHFDSLPLPPTACRGTLCWHRGDIQKDRIIGLHLFAERIKEPEMGVQFPGILFL